jgi:sugar phosphate isomerase/epimerase
LKLSVLPVSYFKAILSGEKRLRDWAREGAELGLEAIDLTILFLKDRSAPALRAVRREIEAEGISVAAASTYPDFTHPDPRERKKQREEFLLDLDALAEVGTRIVRITSGQAHPGLTREEGIRWALEGITGSIEAAKRLGVQLVFENHAKPGVWTYPDFNFPSAIFLALAEELQTTPVKILFDCANPIAFGGDPLPLLEKVITRVAIIHASDTRVKGALEPVVIGTGLVPYGEIFSRLKRQGFDGWISIEEASGTGAGGVRSAVDFIRRTWQRA